MKKRTDMSGRWVAGEHKATWQDAVSIILSMLEPNILSHMDLKEGSRILECGIGSGKWSAGFALLGYQVYAMDDSPAMVWQAHDNFPCISFQGIVKDVRDAPLIYPPVDLLVSEGLIEHFLDDDERKGVLTNFFDATNSYLAIVVPYKSKEEDEIYYTQEQLKAEVEEVGFDILYEYRLAFMSRDRKSHRRQIGVNGIKRKKV